MSHYISRAARHYLLTGQPEREAIGTAFQNGVTPGYIGGCWALEDSSPPVGPRVPCSFHDATPRARFFSTRALRDVWVSIAPRTRRAVGKRHPLVKAFRNMTAGGQRRDR